MSVKKKISNTDFIMATKAVVIARKVLESGCVKDFFHAMNYCMFGTPESVKPFDMIANGLMIGNVSNKAWGDFVADWMLLLNLFKKEDAHDEIFVAFLMMVGMMANSEIVFSHAAFAGAYGNFRVALSRCWMDKFARIGGRKSHDEVIEQLALGVSNSLRTAEVARILSKGEKTRDEYIKLQYEDVKQAYIQVLRRGGKPNLSSLTYIRQLKSRKMRFNTVNIG